MSPTQTRELIEVANHQAEMESLWLQSPTITEALLMAALRHLHAVIEADRRAADKSKAIYWNCDIEL